MRQGTTLGWPLNWGTAYKSSSENVESVTKNAEIVTILTKSVEGVTNISDSVESVSK